MELRDWPYLGGRAPDFADKRIIKYIKAQKSEEEIVER